jgi:alkylation response protein AidB-like acyl-CoA dehydrogenase
MTSTHILDQAQEIAETALFPATLAVDAAATVPAGHLDLLADEGFYGLVAPRELGGPGVDFQTVCAVVETLASGCLCTTFVWMQHHGVLRRLAFGQSAGHADLLPRLVSGECRAGVALGGTLPGPPRLTARPTPDGYVLDGYSPWVTGWGLVDVLAVAARDGDTLVWLLLDAKESDTLTVRPLRMVSVTASNTVTVTFAGHPVPADRVLDTEDHAAWARADAGSLRLNGSLALGLTSRCRTLLGPGPLDAELAACRTRLDTASDTDMPSARAAASELAIRAATTLVASTGSQAVLLDQHAQKLAREALFLLVFASRPGIKQALLPRLIAAPVPVQ